mmetsp:Transcript_117717/g.327837  ORF Transcript_117717/g.327837 Transcript_117717/m.327837 type:complete len:322 (-) Transcript_117717:533-1498(-)
MNSMFPVLSLLLSIGICQCTCCEPTSYMASPGSALAMVGLLDGAAGKRMRTSSSATLSSVSSSSTTTCVPSAVVVGQQLRVTGKKPSSVLLNCHFTSGAGALARNCLDGSLTSRMLLAWDCLFRLGWTLYLNSWFCGASLKQTRSALAVSRTVTWNWPVHTASPLRPPSTCKSAVIFSSISTFTGSKRGFTTAGAAGSIGSSADSCCGAGSAIPRPASASPGFFLVSNMPFLGAPGLRVAGPSSGDAIDADQGGEGDDSIVTLFIEGESLNDELPKDVGLSLLLMPVGALSFGCMALCFASSICFFFIVSLASLILLCSII